MEKCRRFSSKSFQPSGHRPEKVHTEGLIPASHAFLAPVFVGLSGSEDSGLHFLGSREYLARFPLCRFLSRKNVFIHLNGRSVAGFFNGLYFS
jgi:hypothetical protein